MHLTYTWVQMGWIVLICSALGWCAEVAFAAAYPQLREGSHFGRHLRKDEEEDKAS